MYSAKCCLLLLGPLCLLSCSCTLAVVPLPAAIVSAIRMMAQLSMKRLFIGSCLLLFSGILAQPMEQPHDLSAMTRNLPSGSHGHHGAESVDLLEHQDKKRTSDSHLRPIKRSELANLYDSHIPDTIAPAYAEDEEHRRFRRAGVLEKGEKKKNYGNYPEKVLNGFAIERKQPVPEGYKGGDPRLSDAQYDDGKSGYLCCVAKAESRLRTGSEDDVGVSCAAL